MDHTDKSIDFLLVIYDASCAICQRCRHWLASQPTFLPLYFLEADGSFASRHLHHHAWSQDQLVVMASDGRLWSGPSAFVMCFWALRRYRGLSLWLSEQEKWNLSWKFLHWFSLQRRSIAALLGPPEHCADGTCQHTDLPPGTAPTFHPYRARARSLDRDQS